MLTNTVARSPVKQQQMLTNTVAKVSIVTAIQPLSHVGNSTDMGKFAKDPFKQS